jgi:hypothetical protein
MYVDAFAENNKRRAAGIEFHGDYRAVAFLTKRRGNAQCAGDGVPQFRLPADDTDMHSSFSAGCQ